jgi:hypothetical protein
MEIRGCRPVQNVPTAFETRGRLGSEPRKPPAQVENFESLPYNAGAIYRPTSQRPVSDSRPRSQSSQVRPSVVASPVKSARPESEPARASSMRYLAERPAVVVPGAAPTKSLFAPEASGPARKSLTEVQVDRETRAAIELVKDPRTGMMRTWWHSAVGDGLREPLRQDSDGDRGQVMLVGVRGAQVGDGNRQLNVFVRTIEDPKIDFEVLMADSKISAALTGLAANPGDDDRRQAAVDALSGVRRSRADWTTAYAGTGTAILGPGAHRLDGTVAVIRSKAVQVGDYQYQENTIVHTVSPDIAATVLLENPDVVNGLIDLACSPGDAKATAEFERAVSSALVADLANSAEARRGHGTVHRPPAAGRTLRVADTAGVSIGKRVSQKTQFAQTAHLGRNLRRSASRVATDVRHAARTESARSKPSTTSAKSRAE